MNITYSRNVSNSILYIFLLYIQNIICIDCFLFNCIAFEFVYYYDYNNMDSQ